MYALCIWALLLRQHKGMKPKAVIMWVFLTPLSIFSLFSNGHAPNPGQQPIRVPSFGQQPIFTHRRYLYICSLLHFLQTTLREFLRSHAEGRMCVCGGGGGGVYGVSPLIDVGDITYHVLLSQVNNISVTVMRWLYSVIFWYPIMRPLSCLGSGIYWQIFATPKNTLDC